MPTRIIAHLDMDAFYASVELLRYPQLRGQAVVIGGGRRSQPHAGVDTRGTEQPRFLRLREYAGRGVITTATYEARAFGVHSGMGLMKAAQLAPDAWILPTDFDEYRRYSRLFKTAVRGIAPLVEDRGIDEIYIDLTQECLDRCAHDAAPADAATATPSAAARDPWRAARDIASAIKRAVRDATGLSCSIGLSPNKLLSKIASDLDKPDGLTIVTPNDIVARIHPLPAKRINGVGPKANMKLDRLGLRTIGDIAQAERDWLIEQLGRSYGAWLYESAHGRDDRPIVTHRDPKSMSRETTFSRDLHAVRDRAELSEIFTGLCVRLADDLRRKGFVGRAVGVKLRYDDFRIVTRDHTLEAATDDARAIRHAAGQCLKRIPLNRRIRLLGVRIGALSKAGGDRATTPTGFIPTQASTASLFD